MASTIIGGSSVASPSPETPVTLGTNILAGEYGTLSQLRTFLSLASAETSDDTELAGFLRKSSRAIDRYCRRSFYPLRHGGNDVLRYDIPGGLTLRVDERDLLQIHGLSHVNGTSEIDSSVYWLKTGDNWNMTPYDRIVLKPNTGSTFNFSGTDQRAIHVDAVTGYHEQYTYAWVDANASLTSALGTTTTLASVSGSSGDNANGISPRFSAGQIWRLGSGSVEEFVYVRDTINASSVRIVRAVNGTSRTTHASTTPIYVWQPESDIEYGALELAAFMYQKAKSPFTNRVSMLQLGVVEMPDAWPEITLDRLSRYRRDIVHAL